MALVCGTSNTSPGVVGSDRYALGQPSAASVTAKYMPSAVASCYRISWPCDSSHTGKSLDRLPYWRSDWHPRRTLSGLLWPLVCFLGVAAGLLQIFTGDRLVSVLSAVVWDWRFMQGDHRVLGCGTYHSDQYCVRCEGVQSSEDPVHEYYWCKHLGDYPLSSVA